MNKDYVIYQQRRQKVLQQLGENGLAIIFAAPERPRSNDTEYPFRQDSYLYYLTGFPEPESVLILNGREQSSTLLCRNKDIEQEIWTGFRFGPAAAKAEFGFDHADKIENWLSCLETALHGHQQLFALWGLYPQYDQQIMALWHKVIQKSSYRAASKGISIPNDLVNLAPLLNQMRLYKDEHEQKLMRIAGEISAQGHIRAMRTTRPNQFEYQVEAEILHEFMSRGARFPSYNSIVASGQNACCLHYTNNNAQLIAGDLLMIDAGAEYHMYAGDISRTFPINGRFTSAQKDIYDLVLSVNEASISRTVAQANWQDISQKAIYQLTEGLIDVGLLSGNVEENIETNAYRRFYMHGLGHWLGIDVHDVGGRFDQNGQPLLLKEGMVTTIEPGLYIAAADDIPSAFHNIGIRIEDNVLITAQGNEVLTASVPKKIADIEALMND